MIFETTVITSRSNPTIKWAAGLLDKKGRELSKSFIAEGEKLTFEALSSSLPVTHIFVKESRYEVICDKLMPFSSKELFKKTSVIRLSDDAFSKISTEKSPQGVISVIKYLDFFNYFDIIYKEEFFLNRDERALILCSLRDPGNLGSVIRSAVAFGVDRIILTADSVDVYNPKVIRSAMGSLFKVKIDVIADLGSFITVAREVGRRVFSAELTDTAISLSELDLLSTDVFMIGNEGHGIPREISMLCDGSVYIPISSKTESLNASVAAAVFMWEQNKK